MSLKECPDPATLAVIPDAAARLSAAEISSMLRGRSIATGRQRWSPAQLRQEKAPAVGPGGRVFFNR
jgi:hypothetical protein